MEVNKYFTNDEIQKIKENNFQLTFNFRSKPATKITYFEKIKPNNGYWCGNNDKGTAISIVKPPYPIETVIYVKEVFRRPNIEDSVLKSNLNLIDRNKMLINYKSDGTLYLFNFNDKIKKSDIWKSQSLTPKELSRFILIVTDIKVVYSIQHKKWLWDYSYKVKEQGKAFKSKIGNQYFYF